MPEIRIGGYAIQQANPTDRCSSLTTTSTPTRVISSQWRFRLEYLLDTQLSFDGRNGDGVDIAIYQWEPIHLSGIPEEETYPLPWILELQRDVGILEELSSRGYKN